MIYTGTVSIIVSCTGCGMWAPPQRSTQTSLYSVAALFGTRQLKTFCVRKTCSRFAFSASNALL